MPNGMLILMKTDDIYRCPKCGGLNKIIRSDTMGYLILEADTKCRSCDNYGFWCHGFFQTEEPPENLNKTYIGVIKR